jgi:thiol:disulfide interchange protein
MLRNRIAALLALVLALCCSAPCVQAQAIQNYSTLVHSVVYPSPNVARAQIQQAIAVASRQHKHIILDFGGNWCPDCKVLNYYFHQQPNAGMLAKNFVLVDINIGSYDRNLDLAKKYNIPLHKGVPALAVLNSRGRLLYSQTGGQFENMRQMSPDSVTAFLDMWKPSR